MWVARALNPVVENIPVNRWVVDMHNVQKTCVIIWGVCMNIGLRAEKYPGDGWWWLGVGVGG